MKFIENLRPTAQITPLPDFQISCRYFPSIRPINLAFGGVITPNDPFSPYAKADY
ncbi:hypothetical protein [Dyadobacter beijingensis]|uniref:hypothetical protein n=1 Tax=Dyadobacter beijingensis TaxID=365489 RepID=UPI0012F93634|nr:hypothetical protein [Dyadobacter beijingensis]